MFANRYSPFFDFKVFSQECRALGAAATCKKSSPARNTTHREMFQGLIAIGIGATELILVIRTHGLVGGRRKFLIYLIVQLMVCFKFTSISIVPEYNSFFLESQAFSTAILTIVGIATPTWNCKHLEFQSMTLTYDFGMILLQSFLLHFHMGAIRRRSSGTLAYFCMYTS
jgi:hypothetical protein